MSQDLPDLVPPDAPAPPGATASPGQRLAAWRAEFMAWVSTLAQATVYATLVVTFGVQVARVVARPQARVF